MKIFKRFCSILFQIFKIIFNAAFLFVFLYSLPTQFSVLCKPNVNSMKRNFTIKFFMRCTGHDFYGVRGEGRWGKFVSRKRSSLWFHENIPSQFHLRRRPFGTAPLDAQKNTEFVQKKTVSWIGRNNTLKSTEKWWTGKANKRTVIEIQINLTKKGHQFILVLKTEKHSCPDCVKALQGKSVYFIGQLERWNPDK